MLGIKTTMCHNTECSEKQLIFFSITSNFASTHLEEKPVSGHRQGLPVKLLFHSIYYEQKIRSQLKTLVVIFKRSYAS